MTKRETVATLRAIGKKIDAIIMDGHEGAESQQSPELQELSKRYDAICKRYLAENINDADYDPFMYFVDKVDPQYIDYADGDNQGEVDAQ